jgi:hypothetical protein
MERILMAHEHRCEESASQQNVGFHDAAVRQEAVEDKVSRLVQICVGTKNKIEDFRKLAVSQQAQTSQQLSRLEQTQREHLESCQLISNNRSSLETLIKSLIRGFGLFSASALKLLQLNLWKDLKLFSRLCQIQSSIPRIPSGSREDTISFIDVLGRTHRLQYQYFKHWDVFQSMLKCEFEALPGESRVLQGQFHIINARRKTQIISPEQWSQIVFPGSEISMSIIIDKLPLKRGICPRPGCDNPLDLIKSPLVTW